MKKKVVFMILFLILGVGLFVQSILSSGIESIIRNLEQFSLVNFLFFAGISFINFYLYSLRWELIVKALYPQKKIPSKVFFLNRMSSFGLSYVTPTAQLGGEPVRMMLLEEAGVPKKIVASSVVIDKALELAALIIFITTGMLVALIDGTVPPGTKYILLILAIFMLLTVFWFYYSSIKNIGFFTSIIRVLHLKKIKKLENLEGKIHEFEQEMNTFYGQHKKVMKILIIISIITTSFLLVEHFLIAWFMGVNLTFFQIFLASTIPYIAYLIPVPGGLGVLESGHATIFALLGVNINAFAFVFIIRMRDFIFVLIGLVNASRHGISMLKNGFKDVKSPK